jgi:quercetin dioxygenase-like cupin family protein
MGSATVLRAGEAAIQTADWGSLTWYASGSQGNSETMTVGQCIIRPGMSNPRHSHGNCEEILRVLSGRISHTLDDRTEVELAAGDTITIPAHVVHHARNIGTDDAVLAISFSSPDRQTKGEQPMAMPSGKNG